jgi:PAS domain S-box-containing protein
MPLDHHAIWSRRPSRATSWLVSVALVVLWIILALVVFSHVVLPFSYGLPLLVCVWTRDRVALVGMAAIFAVTLSVEILWVLPSGAFPSPGRWAVYTAALISIAITAATVHLIIALLDSIEASLRKATEAAAQVRSQAAELQASEARTRQLAEAMPNLVWTSTADGQTDYLSPQWTQYTGISEEPQLGDRWLEQVHPEDRDALALAWSSSVRNETLLDVEYRIRRHDGVYRWFKARGVCQRDGSGRLVKWLGSNTDIHELRMVDQRKTEFLATLSHELRNPLAAIRYALTVSMGPEGSSERALSVIHRQVGHMARLVDDLLDITRIRSNRFELRIERVDLAMVIQQAVDSALPDVRRAQHDLAVSVPSAPIRLNADPDRLTQVLTNLLSNAARYTPRRGHIGLSVAVVDGMVVISVLDDGVGIRPENLGRIFERFTQLDGVGQGGLGIGLALVEAIVEMHGGHVTAHSEGEGRGSRFDVHLPMAATTDTAPSPAADTPVSGARRRILVVDDNADVADMMKMMLELHGHTVEVAYDGRTALALAEAFSPEIALLDIGLPDIDGYELATRLRQAPATSDTYIIAVSGWGQAEDRTRALERGFAAHLTKPAELAEVIRLVAAVPRER